jgi:1-deoxy-D-xylulose-5-phosphate synthase
VHDVCLQNLPVSFALDRGGLVGADGPTHHGVFDFSFLRHIPNLTVMVPRDELALRRAMATALAVDGPLAYRYPAATAGLALDGRSSRCRSVGAKAAGRADGVIFAAGTTVAAALAAAEQLAAEGTHMAVVDPRFLKPLDRELVSGEARRCGLVVTVEENVRQGGFGSAVLELLAEEGLSPRVLSIGLPDAFIEQGSQEELRASYGLDADGLADSIRHFLGFTGAGTAMRGLR